MDLIKFQYSEPELISNSDPQTFSSLLQEKIFSINPKFSQSPTCLQRLIEFITLMQTNIKNLKLAKNLISSYQSSILFFLQNFFEKSDLVFKLAFINDDSDDQKIKKSKQKYVILLSSISSMYKNLINGVGQIPPLSFLCKYGDSDKEKNMVKSESEFRYLKFLKKCFELEVMMKDPNVRPDLKKNKLSALEDEMNHIFRDVDFWYLQKMTFNKIKEQLLEMIETTKHAESTVKKNPSSKIKANQFSDEEDDNSESVKNILPCCRAFFYENQTIFHPESFTLEYKNYYSPYDNYCIKNLRKTICGFLNREGGVLLVGIMERQDNSKRVKGQFLSQNQKEEVLKEYRMICGQISPDIIGQSKCRVKFVPIKAGNKKYIPGKYILRVEIGMGNEQSLYTYKENKDEYVAIRTANEVLRREINQETLLRFKQKLLDPVKVKPIHDKPCPEPDIGQPIWENNNKQSSNNYNNYQNSKNGKKEVDKKNVDKKDSSENSEEKNLKSKKNKWTEKMEQSATAFSKKDKKPLDFVYFSQKPSMPNIPPQYPNAKNRKFLCDEDEEERNNQRDEEDGEEEEYDADAHNSSLDFRPLNPVAKKKPHFVPKKNSKAHYQPIVLDQPNGASSKTFQYKLEKMDDSKDLKIMALSDTKCIDLIVTGYPFDELVKDIKNFSIPLIEPPIRCNHDLISWIKIKPGDPTAITVQYELFKRTMMKKHEEMNCERKFMTRKVYENIFFRDEVLLNKLIHKCHSSEEFINEEGDIHFKFKTLIEAIQAYVTAYELNIKVRFISTSDMLKKKMEHLKSKASSKKN